MRRGGRRRTITLPGLTIEVFPGAPIPEHPVADVPYRDIFIPSEARGFVENSTAGRDAARRVLPQAVIEQRLDKLLTLRGDFKLNDLRDQARLVAGKLGMERAGARLDRLIGLLLGTRDHEMKVLRSKVARARIGGTPYDPDRIELFDALFGALNDTVFAHPIDPAAKGSSMENFAFFEAYFSNFIEGTTFQVDEAEDIVFNGAIIPNRAEDSHDILGTFRAAATAPWRNVPARTADDFLDWLKSVNALVMRARPDQQPGQWKEKANRAGNTFFVVPEHVPGTLAAGFERIRALIDPVARSLMTMFVISEVHPFKDGNGRTARLAMNCVPSAENRCRIIVPTVYREDYLLPLKQLSNGKEAGAFIRCMSRIHDWTAKFDYTAERQDLREQLTRCDIVLMKRFR